MVECVFVCQCGKCAVAPTMTGNALTSDYGRKDPVPPASHFQLLSCWFCHLYWFSQSGILKVSICASVSLTGKVGEGGSAGFIKTLFSCKQKGVLILYLNILLLL